MKIDFYIKLLREIISLASKRIRVMNEDDLAYKPRINKWSKKEIIGHLVDSAMVNHNRFLYVLSQENLVFESYDQDRYVISNNYQTRNASEILLLFDQLNLHVASVWKNIDDDLLLRITNDHNYHQICMNTLEENSNSSLEYLIWDYIFHIEHHLNQIIPGYNRMLDNTFTSQ